MKPAATPPSAKKAEKKPEKVATTGASDNGGSKKGTKADKSPTSAARGGGGSSASSSPANQQSNALYVGDLSPQVTETMLFEKFSSVGQVMSIRVCRDAVNRRSLGYAYVNYQSSADAAKAIDALNFGELCGRPMRIMWSQRDATTRNNTAGNVFIKNLEKSIDNKAIYQAFTVFGPILSCKVVLDERGDSKGFGFIHFKNEADAEKAIQSVNGMMLSGRPVYAGKFVPRSARQKEDGDVPRRFTNVFVKNFGDVLDKPKLEELFSKYGKIASSAVMTDRDGRPRGFGFVAFENADDAEKAVAALNEYQLPDSDRKLFVGRAQKKSERIAELRKKYDMDKMDRQRPNPGTNLFVKNLSDAVDEDMLREHFEPFGKIATIKVMREENGTTRGFGFVNFEQKDDAHNAMTSLNGKDIGGQDIAVALAQQREERRRQIASLYMRDLAAQRQQHLPMGVFYTAVPGQGGYMMTPTRYMMGAMPQVRNLQQRWNLPPAQPPSHVAYAMPPIVGPFIPPPVIMASNPPPPPPVQQSTVSSNA